LIGFELVGPNAIHLARRQPQYLDFLAKTWRNRFTPGLPLPGRKCVA